MLISGNPVQPLLFVATSAESLVIYTHTDYEVSESLFNLSIFRIAD